MGLAIIVKPNAITLGFAPVALGALCGLLVQHAQASGPVARAALRRAALLRMALAALGLAIMLAAFAVGHVIPNWEKFKIIALAESGALEATWKERLTIPGMWLVSTILQENENVPIPWNPARWSPALMVGFWFCCLSLMLRLRGGLGRLLRSA